MDPHPDTTPPPSGRPSDDRQSDEGSALMLAWRAGDEGAFERLVERFSPVVYAFLTRFLGPVPQREDLVQEVFLRIVRARERYEPTARFSTFLYTIAFNLAANERARADLRRASSLDAEASGEIAADQADGREDTPLQRSERVDAVQLVRDAIAALPEQQRMALILARYEDMPYAEIAAVLGSSEKAIKSLIHRARETLRARLSPLLEEDYA